MNDTKLRELVDGSQEAKNEVINEAGIRIGYVAATLRLLDTALQAGYSGGLYREMDIADDASSVCRILASVLEEAGGEIVELT
jgi:hypothetical protein